MRAEVAKSAVDGQLLVTLTIDPAAAQVTQTQRGARVQLAGWPPADAIGAPDLPTRTIWVALPVGHQAVGLSVRAERTTQLLPGPARVAPRPAPRRDTPDRSTDALRVSRDAPAPTGRPKWARLVQSWRLGDTPIAVVEVQPVSWRPGRPITLAVSLHLRLQLQAKSGPPARPAQLPTTSFTQRTRLARIARANVINPEQVGGPSRSPRSLHNPSADWDYLIITDDLTWDARAKAPTGQRPGMVAAFAELANWKGELGWRARVVTVWEIMQSRTGVGLGRDFQAGAADVQATLRAFLIWAHQHWGITYVLLGGDQHTVPIRIVSNGRWVTSLPTDFYYADLDPTCQWAHGQQVDLAGVDYRCDLSVGRAPAVDATRARTFVDRVISYERAQVDLTGRDDPWTRRLLLAAVKWGGDQPTLIPAASSFPPAVNTYALTPSPAGALIGLEHVIVVEREPGGAQDPGANRWCQVAGTDHIKIHVGPTYKTIQGIDMICAAGATRLPHNPQAGPSSPGWYYTDWADNDGPCHDQNGANCPTSWIIVHPSPAAVPARFELQLSADFRLPYNLLSNLGAGQYRHIPYAADAAATGRGWYFARSATDTGPSPTDPTTAGQRPTNWLFVRADPSELRPRYFVLDPSTEADTMTEKELLRQQLAQELPMWDQVGRLYDDVVDLPEPDREVPPAQYYTLDRLRQGLNEGQHIISLAGHGLPTSTCAYGEGGDFDRSVAGRLTNAPRWGILFANSCLTNRYTEDSLSRHLVLENPNGGVVAYVGFSDSVSIGLGHFVERKFFHDLASTGELGLAFDGRVAMMAPGSGFPAGDDVRYTTLMMTLLGDPAMRVAGAYRYWRAAHLFTAESIVLARIGGYSNASRNSLEPRVHLDWASTQTPGRIAADLRDKHDLAVRRLAGQSLAEAASHFADTVVRLGCYGSGGSGWEVGGALDRRAANDWALRTLARSGGVPVVVAEICRLVDLALADVLGSERHLLEMIYTRESVEVARPGGFTSPVASSDGSVLPAQHRSWARAVGTTLAECRDDLVRKYDSQVDHLNARGPARVADFYAQTCVRLNALGVDFGSTSANCQQYQLHFDWAQQAGRIAIKDALAGRVRRVWEVLAHPEVFPPRLQIRVPAPGGELVGTTFAVGPLAPGQDWVGVITLVNTGGGDFTVTATDLVGPVAALSATVTISHATATPMRAAQVQLRLTAAQPAALRGELRIATTAPDFPLVVVTMEVVTSGAAVDFTPGSLDLGSVKLGSAASGQVRVANLGNTSAGGLFIEVSGADRACFAIPNWGDPNQGIELTAGRTLDLDVAFTPETRGTVTAELLLTYGVTQPKQTRRIAVSGRGTAPMIDSDSATGLDFGLIEPRSTARLPLVLRNTGDADLLVGRLQLELDRFSPFAIVGTGVDLPPELPLVLGPGQRTDLEVQFWAPDPGQVRTDTLIVHSDASNAPQLLIPLAGGTPGPGLTTPIEAVNFGVVAVGTGPVMREVTIASSGTTPVTVHGVTLDPSSPAFALVGLPAEMPAVLQTGQELRFQVTFNPVAVGSHRATVVVASDDPKYPRTRITLSGTAK